MIRNLLFIFTFIVIFMDTSYANRLIIPLNEGWKFIREDNSQYAFSDTNDTAWRTVNLPHDWSI